MEKGVLSREMQYWVMEVRTKKQMKDKLKLNYVSYDKVDLEMTGMAMKKIQTRYSATAKKIVWNEIPTEVKLMRNGYSTEMECKLFSRKDNDLHFLV